jgi:hypothetical protein
MSHFAKVINGIVIRVIVAEQEVINKLPNKTQWIQTSYNTRGGVNERTGVPIRKNYAGIGYTYDEIRDAFISPKPYNSWTLNDESCLWESPIPYPDDDKYYEWNEFKLSWDLQQSL